MNKIKHTRNKLETYEQQIQIEKKSIQNISKNPNRKDINQDTFKQSKQKGNELRTIPNIQIETKSIKNIFSSPNRTDIN